MNLYVNILFIFLQKEVRDIGYNHGHIELCHNYLRTRKGRQI